MAPELYSRDMLLGSDLSGLGTKELSGLYASLEGRARRELDLNFGQSQRLACLHDSMSLVASFARTRHERGL
jgi:hypothetical protein